MTLYRENFEGSHLSFYINSSRDNPTSNPVFYISKVSSEKECDLKNNAVLDGILEFNSDLKSENVHGITKKINDSLMHSHGGKGGPTDIFFSGETIKNPQNVERCFQINCISEPNLVEVVDEWTHFKNIWIRNQCTESVNEYELADYDSKGAYKGLGKFLNVQLRFISTILLTFVFSRRGII